MLRPVTLIGSVIVTFDSSRSRWSTFLASRARRRSVKLSLKHDMMRFLLAGNPDADGER